MIAINQLEFLKKMNVFLSYPLPPPVRKLLPLSIFWKPPATRYGPIGFYLRFCFIFLLYLLLYSIFQPVRNRCQIGKGVLALHQPVSSIFLFFAITEYFHLTPPSCQRESRVSKMQHRKKYQ